MIQGRTPAVVLFDIDGTLLHAGGAGRAALDAALAQSWDLEDASDGIPFAGGTDPELVREILYDKLGITASGVDEEMVRMVLGRYLACLPEQMARATDFVVLPGARALVEKLAARKDVQLALATGNIAPGARIKLAKAQMNRFFATGGFGGDAPTRAGIVGVALERVARILGRRVDRKRTFLVGDTSRDIKSAVANGIVPVGVTTGPEDAQQLLGAGASIVLETLARADVLLEQLDTVK